MKLLEVTYVSPCVLRKSPMLVLHGSLMDYDMEPIGVVL